jgi:pantothenate kinase-related protein Tda10
MRASYAPPRLHCRWRLVCKRGPDRRMTTHAATGTHVALVGYVGARINARCALSGRPLILGITGGPGVGKTTFAESLLYECARSYTSLSILKVALEDFYFPADELRRRGFTFRASPGSHDVDRLVDLVTKHRQRDTCQVDIPRFNMSKGYHDPDLTVLLPVDVLLIEGYLLGWDVDPYAAITRMLDELVYLEAPLENLEVWRKERESRIRLASNNREGLSESQMAELWSLVLGPTVTRSRDSIKRSASLLVRVGANHDYANLLSLTFSVGD